MGDWFTAAAMAVHGAGFRWRCQREAARLRHLGEPEAVTLADVLTASLSPHDAETDRWFSRIEAIRSVLQRDDAVLTFKDYGVPSRISNTAATSLQTVRRPVHVIAKSSAPAHEARLLFHLIRRFAPQRCLELGTCLGISAAYQAAALQLNASGHLVTLEGGAALAERATQHLQQLNLSNTTIVTGRFQDTLPEVLDTYGPFDYAFIDGHHDPDATLGYYRQLQPHLTPNALLVFDDIIWTPGMRAAWRTIREDAPIWFAADLLTTGICFFSNPQP